MKLDRNLNRGGKGKYALVLLRSLNGFPRTRPALARAIDQNPKALDFGWRGSSSEFFVIRLKDKYAQAALHAYAEAARKDDPQYAAEIEEMAKRSGPNHPACKKPD